MRSAYQTMASAKRRRATSDIDAKTSEARSTTSRGTRNLDTGRSRGTRYHSAEGDDGSDFAPNDEDDQYENDEGEREEMPSERYGVEVSCGCRFTQSHSMLTYSQTVRQHKKPRRRCGDVLKIVATAVPCHGDYTRARTYHDAFGNQHRIAAYLGFDDLSSLHRFVLSAGFLSAYAIYKDVGLIPCKKLVGVLQDPIRGEGREEMISDLMLPRKDGDEDADKLGDALQWLVHKSAEVKDWSHEKQDHALNAAYRALRTRYPALETLPKTYLRTSSESPLWQHLHDPQPDVEQYNRAMQLLRYGESAELGRRGKCTADKWMNIWQERAILRSRPVSRSLVPHWMQERSDGGETVASTEEDGEEIRALDDAHTDAGPWEQSQEDKTTGGTHEDQPLEEITPCDASEQEHQLEGTIRGGDCTNSIEILDSDEDNDQDHHARAEIKAEDDSPSTEIFDSEGHSERYHQIKGEIEVDDDIAPSERIGEDNEALHRSACNILHVTSRKFSRFRCSNKKWFDGCWEQMEYLDAPTNNEVASTDPRDWSTSEEWRDAVRTELRLGTHWRRGEDEGLALKLTSIRLQAEGEKLDCYDCKAEQFDSSPKQVSEFVEKHQHCELEYCIDFFTEEEMADGKANDLETPKPSL